MLIMQIPALAHAAPAAAAPHGPKAGSKEFGRLLGREKEGQDGDEQPLPATALLSPVNLMFTALPRATPAAPDDAPCGTGPGGMIPWVTVEPEAPGATAEAPSAMPPATGFRIVSVECFPAPAAMPPLFYPAAPLADLEPVLVTLTTGVGAPAPVKVLKIVLNPEELGELNVSLKLRGSELTVEIAAASGRAAEVLRQDRTMLEQVIREAGYDAATLTVRLAGEVPAGPRDPPFGPGGHPQHGQRQAGRNPAPQWRDPDEDPQARPLPRRSLAGIYL